MGGSIRVNGDSPGRLGSFDAHTDTWGEVMGAQFDFYTLPHHFGVIVVSKDQPPYVRVRFRLV